MRRLLLLIVLGLLGLSLLAPSGGAASARPGSAADKAGKAVVTSTMKAMGTDLRGRLASDRASCVRKKDVYVIIDQAGQPAPQITYVATTNRQGRWSLSSTRVLGRGISAVLTAVTLGDKNCGIAQSARTDYPGRPGAPTGAVGKAKVRISLTVDGEDAGGKITSSLAACQKYRPVFDFVRPTGSDDPYQATIVSISRKSGKYVFGEDGHNPTSRLGGTAADVLTLVPGNKQCRAAQSPVVRADAR